MAAQLIYAAICIGVVVIVALILVWAIENIMGAAIPARIKQVGMVIIVLVCLLILLEYVPFPAIPYPRR